MDPSLIAALLLLPLLFLFIYRSKWNPKTTKKTLPPSPPRLPFIGNLHQLGLIPHRSLAKLSKNHGPVMLLKLGSIPTLVVSSTSSAQEILKTHDLVFASRPSLKAPRILIYNSNNIAFQPYGEYWRNMRKVCVTHLLSSKMVQSFGPVRAKEVDLMIERIHRKASINNGVVCMSKIFNSLINNVLCKSVFGSSMSDKRRKYLCHLIHTNTVHVGEVFVEDFFPGLRWLDVLFGSERKLKRHFEEWDAILEEIIKDHASILTEGESTNSTKLIDVLFQLQKDSSMKFVLTNEQIKAVLLDMIVAGTETSFIVLDWTMAELVRNPEVMKKVQKEVREIAQGEEIVKEEHLGKLFYMKAVIKEALRLHPPTPLLLPRESLQDCEIQGYYIPKETRVLVNAWAIGRDEEYWEEAEEFKPERFLSCDVDYKGNDFKFIPFGAGRRICPGIQFSIATIELSLANLLHRFDWKLPNGITREDMNMDDGIGITAPRREKLNLVPLSI